MARGRRHDSFDEAQIEFVAMLHEARRALASALAARLGEVDVATACEEVAELEQRADVAEMRLRRRLLVHATVHGAGDVPACLTYMSIGKDAERISDLALGLCRIAEHAEPPSPAVRDDVARVGAAVVAVLDGVPDVIEAEDVDAARVLIKQARAAQQACSARLDDVIRDESGDDVPQAALAGDVVDRSTWRVHWSEQPVALALTYRHLGRIAANALNIVSSFVVPLDRLDYPAPQD